MPSKQVKRQKLEENGDAREAYNALLVLVGSDHADKLKRIKTATCSKIDKNIRHDMSGESDNAAEEEDVEVVSETGSVDQEAATHEDESDTSDPFQMHFNDIDEAKISLLKDTLPFKPRAYPTNPGFGSSRVQLYLPDAPDTLQLATPFPEIKSISQAKIKPRLIEPFERLVPKLSPLQKGLLGPIFNYRDILFDMGNFTNWKEISQIYALHILNHLHKTRDRILKHNAQIIASTQEQEKGNNDEDNENEIEIEMRDQGFTRPKVLVLLPTRNACYRLVSTLIAISGKDQQPENKKRFNQEYGPEGIGEIPPDRKPEDFRWKFAGNTDDMFRLGIKVTRKSLRLFTDFYSSDIIIASPLGLRLAIGDEDPLGLAADTDSNKKRKRGGSKNKGKNKKQDYDFLSSIEICVIDETESLQMQNWNHVEFILGKLDRIPKEPPKGCDFSRVQSWYLDELAGYLRQTLVFSEYLTPEMNSIFTRFMKNIGGKIKIRSRYGNDSGASSLPAAIEEIGLGIKQIFTRFHSPSPQSEDPDNRFKYLTTVVLPSWIRSGTLVQTLLIVPSYLEFVRVRNWLNNQTQVSHSEISEYSSIQEISRSRSLFQNGSKQLLVYTERLHHYRRLGIRGANNIIIYQLPDNPIFYTEWVRNLVLLRSPLDQQGELQVRAIYSKWDALRLERIVGSQQVGPMIAGEDEVYEYS